MKSAEEILYDFIQLKYWKDTHGKDEHYKKHQPEVWKRAIQWYHYPSPDHIPYAGGKVTLAEVMIRNNELQAENERLKEQLKPFQEGDWYDEKCMEDMEASIKRWIKNWNHLDKMYQAEREKVAELEKLLEYLNGKIPSQVEQLNKNDNRTKD
jgi:hypothetical protein